MSIAPHQTKLVEANAKQKANFCNRASAVFPVRVSARSDLRLLFLNYWRLKNGIERVQGNLRFYDSTGKKVFHESFPVAGPHHDISAREKLQCDFDGMVEIELISTENLVFAFPAIIGLYEGDGAFSAVHSAGRIRNSEEPFRETQTEETNWICKSGDGITPFAHVFNGPRADAQKEVLVRLFDAHNIEIARKQLGNVVSAPFSSRVVLFDEIFGPTEVASTAFASLTLASNEVFPRLVVGNYHRSHELFECTHSFPHMGGAKDYVEMPASGDFDVLAYLALPQPPQLELECRMHPTTAPSQLEGSMRATKDLTRPLSAIERKVRHTTGGPEAALLKLVPAADDLLTSVDFCAGRIPARTTICHKYRVRNAKAPFSTDISAGVSPLITPIKKHHWGNGLVSDSIETVIMLNNIGYKPADRVARVGSLTVYGDRGFERSIPVRVEPESGAFIYLREVVGDYAKQANAVSLSWLLKLDNPGLDAYWVSFAADGRICGDHAF